MANLLLEYHCWKSVNSATLVRQKHTRQPTSMSKANVASETLVITAATRDQKGITYSQIMILAEE
jgi:hypothetical protein